jgi:PD-(D/E)XK nuclease superfamily
VTAASPGRIRRVNRGSGHSYTLDGESVPGVTTIIDGGIPKPNLIGWAANTTAGYAVDHWAELAELTPSKRLAELQRSRHAERKAAATRGTDVHAFAAALAQGAELEIPEPAVGMVDAYLEFVAAYRVREIAVEATIANLTHRYAGTLDLIATLDGAPELTLIDWKTGGSGVWPEVALQLAAYANAELIVIDELEQPMPAIERALVVWLRSDGFDVYPIEIGPAVFRTFLYAQQISQFTGADRGAFIGDALKPRQLELEVDA